MAEQTGPQATARRLAAELPDIRYVIEHLPVLARRIVDQGLQPDTGESPLQIREAFRIERRRYFALGGAAGVIAAALLIGLDARPEWAGWAVGAASIIALFLGRPKPPLT